MLAKKLTSLLPDEKSRNVALAAGGMAALLAGRKVLALGLFARGIYGLEQEWRRAHPDFQGGLAERWDRAIRNYEATHADAKNRALHRAGIPLIAGGAAGLVLFPAYRPLWLASAATFAAGWALNLVGHARYEKNAPAFADDPLSFLAGPVWDVAQTFGKKDAAPASSAARAA
jgi:hypothetical protein